MVKGLCLSTYSSVPFTAKSKRELVSRDQVFPLLVVYHSLLLQKHKVFHAGLINKNCFGEFLSAHFFFEKFQLENVTLNISIYVNN